MVEGKWSEEGYWNTVIGDRSASQLVAEFELDASDRVGLSEWLGHAEAEAWRAGKNVGPMPTEWVDFHERALDHIAAHAND